MKLNSSAAYNVFMVHAVICHIFSTVYSFSSFHVIKQLVVCNAIKKVMKVTPALNVVNVMFPQSFPQINYKSIYLMF